MVTSVQNVFLIFRQASKGTAQILEASFNTWKLSDDQTGNSICPFRRSKVPQRFAEKVTNDLASANTN